MSLLPVKNPTNPTAEYIDAGRCPNLRRRGGAGRPTTRPTTCQVHLTSPMAQRSPTRGTHRRDLHGASAFAVVSNRRATAQPQPDHMSSEEARRVSRREHPAPKPE